MMPVATVQSLGRAGCLVLRKGLTARSALFHAREDGRVSTFFIAWWLNTADL